MILGKHTGGMPVAECQTVLVEMEGGGYRSGGVRAWGETG